MKALILAAGFGTRLRPHTDRRPKPLFSMAGRTLLDRIIDALEKAGCTSVAVNTHHLADQVCRHVAEGRYSVPVWTRHEPDILGTGGAIANLRDFWDREPFMVVNSDIVTDIDLKEIYRSHCDQSAPVTLVLVDDPAFNSVSVNPQGKVIGFGPADPHGDPERRLTFTGIQVIDPAVLDYFPQSVFFSSINAYDRMIDAGIPIRAAVVEHRYWADAGTPERYRAAALEMTGRSGFQRVFGRLPGPDALWQKLAGDGSDRRWHRLVEGHRSIIVADHGITDTDRTSEVDAFVAIGRHLHKKGLPVPEIFFQDRFSGMVCIEDLGDVLLQDKALKAGTQAELLALYGPVVQMLVDLSVQGAEGFDPAWTHQSPAYDRATIVNAECRYFIEAFCKNYLGMDLAFESFAEEFEALATKALDFAIMGFMHRDFQSRNLMVHNGRCRIIDFQGGRPGPIQYDLASLLIDPYTKLPELVQEMLLAECIASMQEKVVVDATRFRKGYTYCRITRNLQMLGAFGHLTRVKGKSAFEAYIPRAAATLNQNLTALGDGALSRLNELARELTRARPRIGF
ncbi:MAG: phosphotransferase [Desulfobacterales bacterium]|nr:phosphotransferase [Desulfobacterales bacterium]